MRPERRRHLAGNLRSRWSEPFTTDGEKPDRNRDGEFEIAPEDSRERLMARWHEGWEMLFSVIVELHARTAADPAQAMQFLETPAFRIRNEPHTPLQALLRQVGHYAYHVGQIVLLARSLAGSRWQTLSIARGESAQFNSNPRSYLR